VVVPTLLLKSLHLIMVITPMTDQYGSGVHFELRGSLTRSHSHQQRDDIPSTRLKDRLPAQPMTLAAYLLSEPHQTSKGGGFAAVKWGR